MSNEEEKRCPLCAEEMDWTDQQFMPCKCGYQVCVWCWHHIIDTAEKDATDGRCPACRTIYEKEKIVAMQAKSERTMTKISNRKTKPPKVKPKANEVNKDLTNVRVIQRKMAYVIGLPLSLANEDVLLRKEFFGQYGKVTKVSLSRTAGGAIQQFVNDTCSAYITYSKEEEALRCIQSVHGFVLEGKLLRASFGTAKYCHAWLKNIPCNNPACLYLHSIGTDEDSFGKDEVAAVHTRSRVQQIVGATNNLVQRSGNVLPPADDIHNGAGTFIDSSTVRSGIPDAAHCSVNSTLYPLVSKEKEVTIAVPHKMTSFVDIVGRAKYVSTEKDESTLEDGGRLDLCSELSSVTVGGDSHAKEPYFVPTLFKISSSDCVGNGSLKNMSNGPLGEDPLLFNNEGSKETCDSSNNAFFHHPSYSFSSLDHSDGQALLPNKMCSVNDFTVDQYPVHNHKDEASLQSRSVNSVLNDSSQEMKFQNAAKSDRIYRSSRSFSNEEIVEHLRRIDDDKFSIVGGNPAFDAVESSIISNIMSIDFDSCEDSLKVPNRLSELLDETYGLGGSSWSSLNSDQSGYSFVKQDGFANQTARSILPEYEDNKEQHLCKPQYPVNRAQCLAPPGFLMSSRDPPPGFSTSDGIGSLHRASSGGILPYGSSLPSPLVQPSSTRLGSGIDDVDLFDPALFSFPKGKQTNGFRNPGRAIVTPRSSAFEDESRLWLSMQQSASSHQDLKFSPMFKPPTPYMHQEPSYTRNHLSGLDDMCNLSTRLGNEHQDLSFFTQMPQEAYGNSQTSYRHSLNEVQEQNKGEAEVERLGGNRYFPGYGDIMLSAGNVFGL